jgi:pectinesterase
MSWLAVLVHREQFKIPDTKGPITLQGVSALTSVIKYGDYAEEADNSTSKSATVSVLSDLFIAQDITFANTHPPPAGGSVAQQAVAFLIAGDKAQFYRVAFLGAQDTLYDKKGRHYYKDCYMKGSIDFIFGAGEAYFDRCNLVSIANPGSGSLTAQKKSSQNQTSGFVFNGGIVTGNGPIYLGRAWGRYSKVVFVYTDIEAPIYPDGWYNWGDPTREKTVFYGQYKCYGPGANTTGRVSWSKDLTDEQAQPFLSWDYVDGSSWIGQV